MSALRVSIVTNAKEDTRAYTDKIFPKDIEVLLQTEQELMRDIANIDVSGDIVGGQIHSPRVSGDGSVEIQLIVLQAPDRGVDIGRATEQWK